MVIDRSKTLFPRDEKGELISQEVSLVIDEEDPEVKDLIGQTIRIIPFKRGEFIKRLEELKVDTKEATPDFDADIIVNKCKEPKYAKEDVPFLKLKYAKAIVDTVLYESGLSTKKTVKKAIEEKEDAFGKN